MLISCWVRNIHNWVKAGYAEQVYAVAYKALKPGGIFGVEEHRGNPSLVLSKSMQSPGNYLFAKTSFFLT